jgi:hypothetical protein
MCIQRDWAKVIVSTLRALRQDLGHSLKGFQELTLTAFGSPRDGFAAQVRRVRRAARLKNQSD